MASKSRGTAHRSESASLLGKRSEGQSSSPSFRPFTGIGTDLGNVLRNYAASWRSGGIRGWLRLLAPSTFIFFASVVPALAFGEQLADETGDTFGGFQVGSPVPLKQPFAPALCYSHLQQRRKNLKR